MPTFSIKALKVARFASEETLCFKASVFLDGKRLGTASNEGHGGPNLYDFKVTGETQVAALAYAKEHVEWWEDSFEATSEVLDSVIGDLIDKVEEAKTIKRWTKTKVLFRLKGDPDDGSYRTLAHNGDRTAAVVWINNKYGAKVTTVIGGV